MGKIGSNSIIKIKAIAEGSEGRMWCIAEDQTVYTWIHNQEEGLSGDTVEFTLSPFISIIVNGPWCGSMDSFIKDTGFSPKSPIPKKRRLVGNINLKTADLQSLYERKLKESRDYYARSIRDARKLRIADDVFGKIIPVIENFGGYWIGGEVMYLRLSGNDKQAFSNHVKAITNILNIPPEIKVLVDEYTADFEVGRGHRIHAYMQNLSDCKTITVEETQTRTVIKPHPECLSALQELEQL